MSDYDSWKLATPWDSEVATTVTFDCEHCDKENKRVEVVIDRGDEYVDTECGQCGKMNAVYF